MHSYPNLIPERPRTIRRALGLIEPLPFEWVYGAGWHRSRRLNARQHFPRSRAVLRLTMIS